MLFIYDFFNVQRTVPSKLAVKRTSNIFSGGIHHPFPALLVIFVATSSAAATTSATCCRVQVQGFSSDFLVHTQHVAGSSLEMAVAARKSAKHQEGILGNKEIHTW